jgi:hypothetical protein
MPTALKTKPGINGANVLSIPNEWDATWFRKFINNSLKGADVRNAIAGTGITITGNISSPYATISAAGGGGVSTVSLNDTSTVPIYTTTPTAATAGAVAETITLNTQTANYAFLGPLSGPPGQPKFRQIQIEDIAAALGSVGFPADSGLPGTIPTLCYWFDAATMASGRTFYPILTNQAPGFFLYSAITSLGNLTVSTTLNSLNVGTFNGLTAYVLLGAVSTGGIVLSNSTVFVVMKPTLLPSSGTVFGGGANNAYALFVNASSQLSIIVSGVAIVGASTAPLTTGAFVQANATYNSTGGAFAFRQSRTAAGAGSSAQTVLAGSGGVFCLNNSSGAPSNFLNAQVAELIIYNSVLSATQITNIENYLFAKWGV